MWLLISGSLCLGAAACVGAVIGTGIQVVRLQEVEEVRVGGGPLSLLEGFGVRVVLVGRGEVVGVVGGSEVVGSVDTVR